MAPKPADILRRCTFRPYDKGGPVFRLTTWDTNRVDEHGKYVLGYKLTMQSQKGAPCVILFQGEDFSCSPQLAVDSDGAVEGIMGFLTLRPGDTDDDHFASYTPGQLAYCDAHAESLSCEVQARFCDENGNLKAGRRGR